VTLRLMLLPTKYACCVKVEEKLKTPTYVLFFVFSIKRYCQEE
jgi:hypothetical protein